MGSDGLPVVGKERIKRASFGVGQDSADPVVKVSQIGEAPAHRIVRTAQHAFELQVEHRIARVEEERASSDSWIGLTDAQPDLMNRERIWERRAGCSNP